MIKDPRTWTMAFRRAKCAAESFDEGFAGRNYLLICWKRHVDSSVDGRMKF